MSTDDNNGPTKILDCVRSQDYVNEHITHFFDVYSMKYLMSANQETKERAFEMFSKHQNLLIKLFGEGLSNSKLILIDEYNEWLSKQ